MMKGKAKGKGIPPAEFGGWLNMMMAKGWGKGKQNPAYSDDESEPGGDKGKGKGHWGVRRMTTGIQGGFANEEERNAALEARQAIMRNRRGSQ